MYRLLFPMTIAIAFVSNGYPQTPQGKRTISGLVSAADGSGPLEGVVVAVKGAPITSGSQQDGMYYIEVPANDSVLVFSREEYQTAEVRLCANTEYNIALKPGQGGAPAPASPTAPAHPTPGNPPAPSPERASFSALGSWRGLFELRPGVEVPFNFDIRTDKSGKLKAFFKNGSESFEGGTVKQTADSLFIFLDQFDNELAFKIGEGALTGTFSKQDRTGTPLPVKIEPNSTIRFAAANATPAGDISGTYDVTFNTADGKEEKVVGLFRQQGNKLTGTFLRVTGDSRYLEGIVEGNDFYLSSFYGSGPAYYKGQFTADGQITGENIGARGSVAFKGVKNDSAALPDAYKLTYLKPGYTSFDFSLPDIDGNTISLKDKKFHNKVVVVTIGGTWCPNCVDETSFLAPWYTQNKKRGVEIISIQYERKTDTAFVRKVLTRMRDRYDIQYTQVFGGVADKQVVANSLPSLNTFLAFPTTIFIDKQGRVAEIHTGYSGPATGIYYDKFLQAFNGRIDALLAAK
jgi:peroxiredoxin